MCKITVVVINAQNGEKDVSVFLLLFEGLGIYIALVCDSRKFVSELKYLYTFIQIKSTVNSSINVPL